MALVEIAEVGIFHHLGFVLHLHDPFNELFKLCNGKRRCSFLQLHIKLCLMRIIRNNLVFCYDVTYFAAVLEFFKFISFRLQTHFYRYWLVMLQFASSMVWCQSWSPKLCPMVSMIFIDVRRSRNLSYRIRTRH